MSVVEKRKRNIANQMPEQNGVRAPRKGTVSAKVWSLADELSKQLTKKAIKKYEKEHDCVLSEDAVKKMFTPTPIKPIFDKLAGESTDTNIRNQYSRWRKFHGIEGRHVVTKKDK